MKKMMTIPIFVWTIPLNIVAKMNKRSYVLRKGLALFVSVYLSNTMLLEHPDTFCGYWMCAQAGVCSHLVIQSHEAVSVVVGERGLRWVCTDWVSWVSIRKTLHWESRGYTNSPKHSTHKQMTFRSSSCKLSYVDMWARYMSIITYEMSHHIFWSIYDLNGQYLTKAKWWLKYTKQFGFYGVFLKKLHTYTE